MYSLFDLNAFIRRVLALNFQEPVWITAEVAQLGQSRGHYYIDLVQKGDEEEVLAQAQAVLWSADYRRLYKTLGDGLESVLKEGLEVKLFVRVDFHERFGLKLQIADIDPGFTLGQLTLQRMQTMETLRREGLLGLNGRLALPAVLQRIAVITSEGAAGFQDFKEHLAQNPYGYTFQCMLFNTAVQGRNTGAEMIAALEKAASLAADFDVAVIIRGGGARLDLSAFDGLGLCAGVARMPVPVLAGIGHETDETLLDLVAHTSLKTPTAVADFLLQHNAAFEGRILEDGIRFRAMAASLVKIQHLEVARLEQSLFWSAREKLRLNAAEIEKAVLICTALNPDNVLRRGFSITMKNGKVVASSSEIRSGDLLETRLRDGRVQSVVHHKKREAVRQNELPPGKKID